jgi:hypothetical protein
MKKDWKAAGVWVIAGVMLALIVSPLRVQAADPGWAADPKTGCRVWDPHPQPRQSISWSGGCVDGFAEGRGSLRWLRDALSFETDEGQWHKGRQIGKGVQTWPTGRYDGELQNGEPAGHGILTLGDARYEGEFENGKPHGIGTLTNSSGIFQGAWKDGCFRDEKRKASIGVPLASCP